MNFVMSLVTSFGASFFFFLSRLCNKFCNRFVSVARCDKDTAGNRHVARRFHHVRQGTALNEHKFHWMSTKHQLADVLTKVGSNSKFKALWEILLHDNDTSE